MKELKYLIHLRWYYAGNYACCVFEQIALWHYQMYSFFWILLFFNVMGQYLLGKKLEQAEKQYENTIKTD
jgi:hypothetical protein